MHGTTDQTIINVRPYPKTIADFAYGRTKQIVSHKYPGGMNISMRIYLRDQESEKDATVGFRNVVNYNDVLTEVTKRAGRQYDTANYILYFVSMSVLVSPYSNKGGCK